MNQRRGNNRLGDTRLHDHMSMLTRVRIAGKLSATATISGLLAFAIGSLLAKSRATTTALGAGAAAEQLASTSVADDNRRLAAEIRRLATEAERLKTASAKLIAQRKEHAPTPSGLAGRIIGLPLQRHEIEESVLTNLRYLAAAQDQFKLEHGRWPASIHELVGGKLYVTRIRPADGESYDDLLWGGRTFRLTTQSGVTVAYANDEPADTDAPEFAVTYPPEVIRARALDEKLADAKQAATEAYRMANRGRNPPHDEALLAFFNDPQDGADFVEYLELKKLLPDP
jgi:hypothetical protein